MSPIDETWMSSHSPRNMLLGMLLTSAKMLLVIFLVLHFGELIGDRAADMLAKFKMPESPAHQITRLFDDLNGELRKAFR